MTVLDAPRRARPDAGAAHDAAPADMPTVEGGLVREAGLLALGLGVVPGLCRLTTTPGAWRVAAPAVVAVVAGHAVSALARRRLRSGTAFVLGALAVGLVSVWWFVPGATVFGVPTPAAAAALGHRLSAAGRIITGQATPLPPASGVVLCLAAGAGVTAVLARSLVPWGRTGRDRPALIGIVPGFGVFCYGALLSSEIDRVQAAAAFVVGALCFLGALVAAGRRISAGTVAVATVAVAVVVGTGPALAGMRLDAIPFHGGSGAEVAGSGPGSTVDALDLLDDLRAVITSRGNELLFKATSHVPTYWQVATLSSFDGTAWRPDPATLAAAGGRLTSGDATLPELATPRVETTFATAVTLDGLRSPLLPVPPGALAVTGLSTAVVVPTVGVYDPAVGRATASYLAVAPAPGSPPAVAGAPVQSAVSLAPYLALPPLAPAVVRLAHRLVDGAAGPFTATTDLLRYFATGHFRYSLGAPTASGDPLSAFLFDTKAGFCQQFAGAFAVLARVDGLPTRLAVGFTAGTPDSDGTWHVVGADAHVWPQVYLGPADGWVSFEPTPPAGTGPAAAGVVSGRAGATTPPRLHPNTPPSTATTSPRPGRVHAVPGATKTTRAQAGSAQGGGGGVADWVWVLASLAVAAGGLVLRRRIHRALAQLWWRSLPPGPAVLAAWRSATRELARRRLGRKPAETITEHASRVARAQTPWAPDFAELAGLATRACYGPAAVGAVDAATARRLHHQVWRQLTETYGRRSPATTTRRPQT